MANKKFSARSTHPYYIAAPAFRASSGGIRALHYLCHALNEIGHEAYVLLPQESCNPYLRTPALSEAIREQHRLSGCVPIALYPEVVRGNPLEQAVVARWLLNLPGHLGGDEHYPAEDLIFYWEPWFLPAGRVGQALQIPIIDRRIFNEEHAPARRQGFCYYANKYFLFNSQLPAALTENGISLCQNIRRSPEEIADILRTCEVLYCYEPSSIALEALLCGCALAYVDTPYLEIANFANLPGLFKIKEADIGKLPVPPVDRAGRDHHFAQIEANAWAHVERFVETTQAAAEAHRARCNTSAYRLQEGTEAFHRGNGVRAMDRLAPLLDELPDNPLPPAYLAFICAERGLAREAEDFLARALAIAPERADLEAALGETFLKTGNAEAACRHLQNALAARPDLLAAYPALAQSLHLLGRTDEAIALLQGVAAMPEAADTPIRAVLLELLAARGDLATFAETCLRHARGLADDLLAARCFARFDPQGDRLLAALLAAQEKLADSLPPLPARRAPRPAAPWRIAFMASDFRREERLGRLKALLTHLPAENFFTGLVSNDAEAIAVAGAQVCVLLADRTLDVTSLDDTTALAKLEEFAPDVLIDLDAYDPAERLAVFLAASAPTKLLWGEAPLPPLAAEVLPICGEALADPALPSLTLAGLGECLDLPDLPLGEASAPQKRGRAKALATPTRFACLTPAIRLGPAAWELFAAALQQAPQSTLTLNLGELGEAARNFLCRQFARLDIAPERLLFVQPEGLEALCRAWQAVDIGLAAPVDAGERALPACLWMGRPYIALAGGLPWSHRPAALLRAAGAAEWLAETPEDFAALARRPAPAPNPEFRQRLMAAGLTDPAGFARDFAERILAHLQLTAHPDKAAP